MIIARSKAATAAPALLAALAAATLALSPGRAASEPSAYMRSHGPAHPPFGFVQFCVSNPAECAEEPGDDRRIAANPENLSLLDSVNRWVNKSVQPATDQDIYGVSEFWTLPGLRGDCEDYALLKRHILIRQGWPAGALVMTVVRDEKGEGHAVLTARLTSGDVILDNKVDEIRVWHKTPYAYVMRQSFVSPRTWVALDPRNAMSPSVLAGVRPSW